MNKKQTIRNTVKACESIDKVDIAINRVKFNSPVIIENNNTDLLINFTTDLFWSVGTDFKLISANNAFIKSLQQSTGKIIKAGDGLLIEGMFPDNYLRFWEQRYKRALLGECFREEIFSPALNNNEPSWNETNFNPIYKEGIIAGVACFSRNITDKKLTQEKLRRNEVHLAEARKLAKLGTWSHDFKTGKITWSDELFNVFGTDKQTFLEKYVSSTNLVDETDRDFVLQTNQQVQQTGMPYTITYAITTPGGEKRIIQEYGQGETDERGKVIRTFGTTQDITESVRADEAIKKALEEKNTILERIDDGFFAIDKKDVVTYWNKRAEILLNAKREDMIGRNVHEVFAHSGSRPFYDNYQKANKENITIHFTEFSVRTNKWFEVSAYGTENGLSVYFKDVTDKKTAEEKIRKSEAKYRTLFEQNMAGIYQTTPGGVILDCNEAFAKMLKYDSTAELLKINTSELYFSATERNDFISKVSSAQNLNNYESVLKCKDGSALHIIENIQVWKDESTGSEFFNGIIIDVTEKKQAELKLKESNERYNLISRATNDMVWDWDLLTGKVYRNQEGWKKLFRTGDRNIENELIEDWNKRIHPDDEHIVKQVSDEIKTSEKDFFEVECRMRRDDGSYVFIHDRGYIMRDKDGNAVRLIGATQDITERKEAELQVAKSELRFRSLVQNSSDLICIFDERGYFLYCSPAIKQILGFDQESTIGKNAFALIHPDDISLLKSHLNENRKNVKELPLFRFTNNRNEWRWVECKVTDMSRNPDVAGYVFNCRDVTDRKVAEAEIEKLSLIARETSNSIIITNPTGEITWVNEGFTKITDFTLAEVLGKKPGSFLQGADTSPAAVRYMHKKLNQRESFECDVINYSKTGRKYWIRIQVAPQFNESGKLKHFFAIQTDITKEKEAEEILKTSEERYRYLFNNNPASIFIWDINTFEILEVNDTAVKLYGYYKKEFLTKTKFEISTPGTHDEIRQFAAKAALQQDNLKFDHTGEHINKSGEKMFMNITSHRIDFKGRIAILALATNITEKVQLENALEKEKLLKQKAITAAVISAQEQERQELGAELHDNVNQILAGSLLYLGMAKKELKTDHPYLKETDILVNNAIKEIRNLSHALITPSLNESEFLDALKNIIEVTQKTSGIMISLQASGFDESSTPDKLKLTIYRIVQEQINNILKHAAAQNVIVHLFKDNEKTLLSIKDDGAGFDTSGKTTGVGLLNIKTRASLLNGDVSVISSPGHGCELRVLFN